MSFRRFLSYVCVCCLLVEVFLNVATIHSSAQQQATFLAIGVALVGLTALGFLVARRS